VLHHDAGTKVSFVVWNVGAAAGTATVTAYVDDQEVQTWPSDSTAPGTSSGPDDRYVRGCGRYPPRGRYVLRVVVAPARTAPTNEVDIA